MKVWSAEIKELEKYYKTLKGRITRKLVQVKNKIVQHSKYL